MIVLPLLSALGVVGLAAAAGCLLGLVCAWHPGHEDKPVPGDSFADGFNAAVRSGGPRHAGYLPLDNTGCYEPRTDWPEPDWPVSTFSEISAGFDQLERNVIAQTQPFGRVRP